MWFIKGYNRNPLVNMHESMKYTLMRPNFENKSNRSLNFTVAGRFRMYIVSSSFTPLSVVDVSEVTEEASSLSSSSSLFGAKRNRNRN